MRRIILPLLPLLFVLLALPAHANEHGRELGTGLRSLNSQHDRALQDAATQIGSGHGLSTAGARNRLETLAVYRELRAARFRVDWKEIDMPKNPGNSVLAAVGRYGGGYHFDLNGVDAMIAKDEAFLARGGNNADNNTYVTNRLAALRRMRTQVEKGAMKWARELALKGDAAMDAFVAVEFSELESRAKQAERDLGKDAKGKPATDFAKTLKKLRDIQRRRALYAGVDQLHRDLAAAANEKDEKGGNYVVVVLHIQSQSYGGYGVLIPGKKTSLKIRDTYGVVMDKRENIQKRMKAWQSHYDYDWCLSTTTIPLISRSSVSYLLQKGGLSYDGASKAYSTASKALKDSGMQYTNLGWAGPGHNAHLPFTVPGNVKSIRRCGT